MALTKKQKAELAHALSISSAVALFLIFIVRDVIRENLKDKHDSLAQAAALYEIHDGQNRIAMRRIQSKNLDPNLDITELRGWASEALYEAERELDHVSELIDALPSSATGIRKGRDEDREGLKQEKASWSALPDKDGSDAEVRQRMAVYENAFVRYAGVLLLGRFSVREAKEALQVEEHLIRVCSYIIYALGSSAVTQNRPYKVS